MEGEPEDEDGWMVLWEQSIEQNLRVDLSEDESFHLSDLETSLVLRLSGSGSSDRSIHLSGSAELSAMDDTSSASSSSEIRNCSMEVSSERLHPLTEPGDQEPGGNTSEEDQEDLPQSLMDRGDQEPGGNTSEEDQEDLPQPLMERGDQEPGGNTSEEDQEDLPQPLMERGDQEPGGNTSEEDQEDLPQSLMERGDQEPGGNTSEEDQEDLPYDRDFNHTVNSEGNLSSEGTHTVQASPDQPSADPGPDPEPNPGPDVELKKVTSILDQMLLRHFSHEELQQADWLLERETLPEVSLLESVDLTVCSSAPSHRTSTVNDVHHNNNKDVPSKTSGSEEMQKNVPNSSSPAGPGPDQSEEENFGHEVQVLKVPLVRTRSFCELKYGQGQVHFPRPDFSKVSPKVRIPKRPVPQSPRVTFCRAQSSPGMLDLVSRVLEDTVLPAETPYIFKDMEEPTGPAMVDHLQAEYDKLMSRYGAENLMDQMRIEANADSSCDPSLHLEPDDDGDGDDDGDDDDDGDGEEEEEEEEEEELILENPAGHLTPQQPSSSSDKMVEETNSAPQTIEDNLSDGDKMTAELRDIVSHLMQKVEEFQSGLMSVEFSSAEQHQMLRVMMEAQDELQRKYLSKKEEHRALEMQKHMGVCRNTGSFDPHRLLEGDIFRTGMNLDDIKEKIDSNVYERISPSALTPTTAELNLLMEATSPPPAPQDDELTPAQWRWTAAGESRVSLDSSEDEDEDEEEETSCASSQATHHTDIILSYLRGSKAGHASSSKARYASSSQTGHASTSKAGHASSSQTGHTSSSKAGHASSSKARYASSSQTGHASTSKAGHASSSQTGHASSSKAGHASSSKARYASSSQTGHASSSKAGHASNRDHEDRVNLTVEVSEGHHVPHHLQCLSQAIISPQTDSGFGSTLGSIQPSLITHRSSSHVEGLNSSRSKPLTAVQSQTSISEAVEHTDCDHHGSLPRCTSAHAPCPSMVTMGTTDSWSRDAILALQSEVSQLKKDLEERLFTQSMNSLTSGYRRDHQQDHRTRTRTRTRTKSRSLQKPVHGSWGQVTMDDWISSDLDQSHSKDLKGLEDMRLQLRDSPVGGSSEGSDLLRGKTCFHRVDDKLTPPSSPLLQVSYKSSSSLPASYKVMEPPVQHHRKRSTQSDTELLPTNVYFQRTLGPVSLPPKESRGRRESKEKDVRRTLEAAIETAWTMKMTTDRMVRRLSAGLAKAQLQRKQYDLRPLGGTRPPDL